MNRRYDMLETESVRDIDSYHKKHQKDFEANGFRLPFCHFYFYADRAKKASHFFALQNIIYQNLAMSGETFSFFRQCYPHPKASR